MNDVQIRIAPGELRVMAPADGGRVVVTGPDGSQQIHLFVDDTGYVLWMLNPDPSEGDLLVGAAGVLEAHGFPSSAVFLRGVAVQLGLVE